MQNLILKNFKVGKGGQFGNFESWFLRSLSYCFFPVPDTPYGGSKTSANEKSKRLSP